MIALIASTGLGAIPDCGPFFMTAAKADVSLQGAGITFPDGSFQSTAFAGAYGAPEEVFRSGCSVSSSTQTSTGRCTVERSIPEGKRLVIETVTGLGYASDYILGAANLGYWVDNGSDTGSLHVRAAFPWIEQAQGFSPRRYFGFSFSGHLYVDGPETLQFDVYGSSSQGSGSYYNIEYFVSGYLVDMLP
ncbi:hypothetical protein CKO23_16420 [Thiocystis violacea]|nr:hypothetical protein [Thiocystis violacea]